VGEENQSFFATFDVRPASARCACDGNQVESATHQLQPGSSQLNEAQFESMVQAITDQIMAAAR
jgi:hypothetical protein